MSQHLASMLVLQPRCDAIHGRRPCGFKATATLTLTHSSRPIQSANLCGPDLKVVRARAEAEGYIIEIQPV